MQFAEANANLGISEISLNLSAFLVRMLKLYVARSQNIFHDTPMANCTSDSQYPHGTKSPSACRACLTTDECMSGIWREVINCCATAASPIDRAIIIAIVFLIRY